MGKFQEVRLQQYLRNQEKHMVAAAREKEEACLACVKLKDTYPWRETHCADVC